MSKEKKEKEQKKNGVGNFILGALVGAGLGVLFAPKSGSETRQELKEKMTDFMKKVKEMDVEEVKENFTNKIEEIKAELEDLDKEKALKIAKEKGNQIKEKCEDLVELAKKKGTPILEKAAEEIREKTIQTIKEVLNKLEKSDSKKK